MEEKMKNRNFVLISATIIILAILSVACGKSQATTAPVESPVNTQVGSAPTVAVLPTSPPNEVPEDVPIMPDAYELQIANSLNLTLLVSLQSYKFTSFELHNNKSIYIKREQACQHKWQACSPML